MSDFLTHLAARAVATAPAVRPLVRSHFEPVADGEITWPAAPREVEIPPAASPQARPALVGKAAITKKLIPPQAPPSPRLAAVLEEETLPVAVPEPIRSADEVGRGQDARTTGGAGILLAASSSPPVARSAAVVTPVPVRFAAEIGSAQDARATGGTGSLLAAASSPPVAHFAAVVTSVPVRFAAEIGSGQDARATGGAGILPAAAFTPPKLPPSSPATLSNQPPARAVAVSPPVAPQVTITIGRVEIRAAALPVQTLTPVVCGPPLSLETYLRRSASRTA